MVIEETKTENFYELLRLRMDKWPTRAPKSKGFMRILKELFTEEEAEILSHFKGPYIDLATPIDIAQRSGKDLEKVIEILNSLADRGLALKMGKSRKRAKYSIWPVVIGIFEFTFSNAKIYPEDKLKRLARLFDNYLNRYMLPTAGASAYPFPRILPSKSSEKVIEINEDLGIVSQKILPFEELEELINQYAIFSVMPCSCREKAKALGESVKNPVETCMTFDMGAQYFIDNGIGRQLTKDEALELLLKLEKRGMVHVTLNAQKPEFICNCDRHCGILKSLTKFHRPGFFASSNFRAVIDESKECTECYRCMDLCPTHAIYPSIEEGTKFNFEIKEDLCIGCGVCSSNCSSKRLILEKIRNIIPEEGMIEAYTRYGKERTSNKLV